MITEDQLTVRLEHRARNTEEKLPVFMGLIPPRHTDNMRNMHK